MAAPEARSRFALDAGTSGFEPTTRRRVVWTPEEKKKLNQLSKIFHDHGDKLSLRCGQSTCPDPFIKLHTAPSEPTGAVLRCGCTDRVFVNLEARPHDF